MLSDLFKTINDRVNSPISGTFLWVWLLCNWKVTLAVIFGSDTQERIPMIASILQDSSACTLYLLPLSGTLLYLFGMPWIRENYEKWIGIVDYRIARNKIKVDSDLAEEREYRETIKAILGITIKEIEESTKQLQNVIDFTNDPENRNKEIRNGVIAAQDRLNNIKTDYERFKGSYIGNIPNAYKYFHERWTSNR